MKFNRSVWVFLVIGVAVRCVAINQPLVDAGLARQCQTAAATESMMSGPGLQWSAKIPWAGDLDARYVQELPIFNFLVIGIYWLVGNLDISGKLATIALWAASFFFLQGIWRRLLDPAQTFWANLLFVIAPLSVFYGQAFMPEMLVQALAFGFVLLVIRHHENPTLGRWALAAGVGLLGLLVKLPEFSHLYFIPIVLIVRSEGWRCVLRPRYLIAAALTVLALQAWSRYVDFVNQAYLPEWTSGSSLRIFLGTWHDRFVLKPWAMAGLYVGAFVFSGPAALAACYGLWTWRRRPANQFLALWLLSLVGFYVVWFGNGGPAQSYYNLPALAPLAALFGLGMSALLAWDVIARWRTTALVLATLLVVLPAVPVWRYLFQQDRQSFAAATWIRQNTKPDALLLFRPNHHWAAVDYPYNACMAYYAQRPTFVWTRHTPPLFREQALARAQYAIVTTPQLHQNNSFVEESTSRLVAALNRFRNKRLEPEPVDWLEEAGFQLIERQPGFSAYRRR